MTKEKQETITFVALTVITKDTKYIPTNHEIIPSDQWEKQTVQGYSTCIYVPKRRVAKIINELSNTPGIIDVKIGDEHEFVEFSLKAKRKIKLQKIDTRIIADPWLHITTPGWFNKIQLPCVELYLPSKNADEIINKLIKAPYVVSIHGDSVDLQRCDVMDNGPGTDLFVQLKREKQLKPIFEKLDIFDNKEREFYNKAAITTENKKHDYLQAKEAVARISDGLHTFAYDYICGKIKNVDTLKKQVNTFLETETITHDLNILKSHRGPLQTLVDVLTAIFSLGSSLIYGAITGNFSLFKVETDSNRIFKSIHKNIDALVDNLNGVTH